LHPNEAGARRYADVIVREYKPRHSEDVPVKKRGRALGKNLNAPAKKPMRAKAAFKAQ
jgi:hypothetical protein